MKFKSPVLERDKNQCRVGDRQVGPDLVAVSDRYEIALRRPPAQPVRTMRPSP